MGWDKEYKLKDGPCKGQKVMVRLGQDGTPPPYVKVAKWPKLKDLATKDRLNVDTESTINTYLYKAERFREGGSTWWQYYWCSTIIVERKEDRVL